MLKIKYDINVAGPQLGPIFVPEKSKKVLKNESNNTLDDVYVVDAVYDTVWTKQSLGSLISTSFEDIRVIHGPDNIASSVTNFCDRLKQLLISWPGKIVIVCSPETYYAKEESSEDSHVPVICFTPVKRVLFEITRPGRTSDRARMEKKFLRSKFPAIKAYQSGESSVRKTLLLIGTEEFGLKAVCSDGSRRRGRPCKQTKKV